MHHSVGRRRVVAGTALLMLGTILGVAPPDPPGAQAAPLPHAGEPKVAVALGDSFTSGEGGRWQGNSPVDSGSRGYTDRAVTSTDGEIWYDISKVYEPTSYVNDCHRSLTAPITYLKDAPDIDKVFNLACSGARHKHVWALDAGGEHYREPQTQIDRLRTVANYHDVELIAIGAGGNDLGFGLAIGHCVKAWGLKHYTPADDSACWDEILGEVQPNLDDLGPLMEKTVKNVRGVMSEYGHAPNQYKIVITGYPSLLPDQNQFRYAEGNRWDYRCPFIGSDAQYINDYLIPQLNGMLEAVAEHMGVGFIDLGGAFDGHRLCEAGTRRSGEPGTSQYVSSHDMEWIRSIDIDIQARDLPHLAADGLGELWPMSYTSFKQFDSIPEITDQGHVSESLHPNYYGQQAIGTCVKRWHEAGGAARKVSCRNGASRRSDDMVVTDLPATGYYANTTDAAIPDTGNPGGGPSNWLDSLVTIPSLPGGAGAEPGRVMGVWVNIDHARKGHLRITLSGPSGIGFDVLREYAPADSGAWYDRFYYLPAHFSAPGTYRLRITDNTVGHAGTLRDWGIRFF